MADLTTSYLGLDLRAPIIASCSPLTGHEDSLLQLAEAGAGAVVLPSLFQEEAEAEELAASDLMDTGDDFAEFASAAFLLVVTVAVRGLSRNNRSSASSTPLAFRLAARE